MQTALIKNTFEFVVCFVIGGYVNNCSTHVQ